MSERAAIATAIASERRALATPWHAVEERAERGVASEAVARWRTATVLRNTRRLGVARDAAGRETEEVGDLVEIMFLMRVEAERAVARATTRRVLAPWQASPPSSSLEFDERTDPGLRTLDPVAMADEATDPGFQAEDETASWSDWAPTETTVTHGLEEATETVGFPPAEGSRRGPVVDPAPLADPEGKAADDRGDVDAVEAPTELHPWRSIEDPDADPGGPTDLIAADWPELEATAVESLDGVDDPWTVLEVGGKAREITRTVYSATDPDVRIADIAAAGIHAEPTPEVRVGAVTEEPPAPEAQGGWLTWLFGKKR